MDYRYFKLNWLELRGDEEDVWGTSWWYFEVDDDNCVKRQIEVYENGKVLKYDEDNFKNEYGGLSDQPLEFSEINAIEISGIEFETRWKLE